jgi:hypothetical protein
VKTKFCQFNVEMKNLKVVYQKKGIEFILMIYRGWSFYIERFHKRCKCINKNFKAEPLATLGTIPPKFKMHHACQYSAPTKILIPVHKAIAIAAN